MKQILLLFIIIALTASCEKFIKEDELNKLSISTESDLNFALAGLYHQFASMNNGLNLLNNRDDMASTNSSSSGPAGCTRDGNAYTPTDDDLLNIYKPLYQSIACANDIFQKSKKLDLQNIEIQHLLGEAYFIRAYSYFWLVRLFGQVPIIDNVDVSYSVKKPSYLDIYKFIENDFQKALNMLPNSNNNARIKYVTPHRGSAKALLAEVYLSWAGYPVKDISKYTLAANMAKDVIDSSAYFGFAFLPDFANLWNGKYEINNESVFSIYATSSTAYGYGQNYNYEEQIKIWKSILPSDIYFGRANWISVPAIKFYNSFPNNYRKDITYLRRKIYVYQPDCIVDSLNPVNTYCPPAETLEYKLDSIDLCTDMYFRKYKIDFNLPDSLLLNSSDYVYEHPNKFRVIYMIRYAHTLLTYAEAKARTGSMDATAFEAVNQIRRRANKVDLFSPSAFDLSFELTPQQFADSVVWERAWEFCAEPESRWFDLLRLEMIGNLKSLKVNNQGPIFPVNINMQTYFFPIPMIDQTLNLNLQE